MRPSLPSWFLPLTASVVSALIGLLGVWQLASADHLTRTLNSDRARSAVQAQLTEAGSDTQALDRRVVQLLRDPELGIVYLAVIAPRGDVLAFSGRYENWQASWLPNALAHWMRYTAYRWSGELQDVAVGEGAHAHFVVANGLALRVDNEAGQRLAWSGVAALLLAAIGGVGAGLSWMRAGRTPDLWLQRLDPDRAPPHPFSPAEIDERVLDGMRARAGGLMDDVERGLIVVDREGAVRYLNRTAERLTGWGLADVQGRQVYTVFHPMDDSYTPVLSPAEFSLRENRSFAPTEMRLRARDGSQRTIEVMATPLRKSGGAVDGSVMLFHDIAGRESRYEHLRRQARLAQGVIDHLVEGVITTDPVGVIRSANARAVRMFGYAREDLEGVNISKLMPVPFLNSPSVHLTDYIGADATSGLPKVVGWRKNATTFPMELVVQPMTIDELQGLLVVVRDITERLRSENLAQRLGRLLDAAAEEVYIFDAVSLQFVEVNRGARRNLGYHPSEMAKMTPLAISQDLDPETFHNYLRRLRGGEAEHLTYRCKHRRAEGSEYPVEVRLHYSREEEPPVFMAIAVDITDREQAEVRLLYLAHHDALTGLPNRTILDDRLRQALLTAQRSSGQVAVMFLDVDRFQNFNDSYGHEVGDSVLRQLAMRLSGELRASDTLARLGGDEFVVVVPGLRNEDDAASVAVTLQNSLAAPFELPGRRVNLTVSIGIAIYPGDDSDADGLLHHADLAMYEAKRAGPGQFRIHQVDLPPERRRHASLLRSLQSALALDQLHVELLPVFDTDGRTVRAMMPSLHWRHPRHGRIDDAEVTAAAIRIGLQSALELARLAAATALLGTQDLPVSLIVPISGWQLRDPEVAAQIAQLVARNHVPPGRLIVVTGVELRSEARVVHETLRQLFDAGVRVGLFDRSERLVAALDRSGLPPLDLVVLDEAEMAGVDMDLGQLPDSVVRALQLARGAGLPSLAPGLADARVVQALRDAGCDLTAGPALHAPLIDADLRAWLAGRGCEPL